MKVGVMPVVAGVLGTIPEGLVNGLKAWQIRGQMDTTQNTAILSLARIRRRVLYTLGNVLPFKLH